MRSMKKVLAATLAATMVMASAMTVCATTENAGSGSSSSSTTQETSTPATYAEANSQSAGASVKVGGVAVQTSIAGVYAAESLKGVAVTTPAADLAAALSLTSGQKAAIIIYDTDQKKSTAAMVSVNAAIEALVGADLVSTLNIDLGAKQNGKWVTLSNGSVALKAGLPKTADTTKTYSAICVQPGGATTILEDQDTDPTTVTFAVQAGLGTYAIIAK